MAPTPHNFNHIAVSVPDAAAAAKWYTTVLGFHELRPMSTADRALHPDNAIFKIYPPDLQRVRIAYLSTGDGVGFELFEFLEPRIAEPDGRANFAADYKRGGFFHVGVTTSDVEGLATKAVAAGAKRIGETVQVFGYEAMYLEDPWGNVVELLNCSFERLMSNRG